MFAIKWSLNGKHANLFKKFPGNCRPNNKFGNNKIGKIKICTNKIDKKNKPVFDSQIVKNRLSVIVIFSVRVFQLKNGTCSHLFS